MTQLGLSFKVVLPLAREEHPIRSSGSSVALVVRGNAYRKASEVANRLEEGLVIGGDTLVVTNRGKVLGKPKDFDDALAMLRLLAGTWHRVLSAVAVVDANSGDHQVDIASSIVFFRKVSDIELQKYVETKEPLEKAGAYAIQGKGVFLIEKISGSYTAVVGLPLELVAKLLDMFGVPVWKYWTK